MKVMVLHLMAESRRWRQPQRRPYLTMQPMWTGSGSRGSCQTGKSQCVQWQRVWSNHYFDSVLSLLQLRATYRIMQRIIYQLASLEETFFFHKTLNLAVGLGLTAVASRVIVDLDLECLGEICELIFVTHTTRPPFLQAGGQKCTGNEAISSHSILPC